MYAAKHWSSMETAECFFNEAVKTRWFTVTLYLLICANLNLCQTREFQQDRGLS